MLEKLAEMVREEGARASGADRQFIPCLVCDMRPASMECFDNSERRLRCPSPTEPEGSLMLARWAVLLAAKGLEKMPEAKIEDLKERKRIEGMPTAEYMCAMSNLGINFLNLLSEAIISDRKAKEEKGMNIAVDSKVKGRMPECVDMDIVVVDAPNLTSDQISELAQPISPDTATQPGTLKTILQQLILINERLEKWEQAYIAYQEMRRVGSRPVYKKKEGK